MDQLRLGLKSVHPNYRRLLWNEQPSLCMGGKNARKTLIAMEHRRLTISIIIALLLGATIIVESPRLQGDVKATSNRVFYTSDNDYVYITQQDLAIKIRLTRRNYRSGGEIESVAYKGSANLVATDPKFGFVNLYNLNGTLLGEYVGGTSLIAATGNNTGKLDLAFQSTVMNDATNGTVVAVNTTIQYTVYSDIDNIFVNVTLASNQTTWILGHANYGSSLNFNTFSSYNATGLQYHNSTSGNLVQGGTIPINGSPRYNILTIMNTTSNLAVTLFPTNLLPESGTIKDDASSTTMSLRTTETSTYDVRNGGNRLYGSNWGNGITYSVCFAFSDTGNPFVVVPWTMPNATPFGLFQTYDDLPSSTGDYLYYPPYPDAANQDAWLAWLNNGTARRTTLMLVYDHMTGKGTPNANGEDGSWLLHGTTRLANMTSEHKAWMASVEGGQLGFQTHAYHHDYPWKWEFSSITNSTCIDATFNQMWLDAQTLGMGNNTFKFFKAAGYNAEPQILDVMTKYGIQQYDRNLDTTMLPIHSFYISNSGNRLILTSDVCDISDNINNGLPYSQLASDLQGNVTTLNFVSIHGHFPNSTTNWGIFNDVFASAELTYGDNLDYFLVPEITAYLNALWSNSYTFNSTTITSSSADSRLTYCLLNRPASFNITASLTYTGTTPFARDLYSPNIATGGYRLTRLTGYANLTNVVSGLQTLNFTITKPATEPAILKVNSMPQPVQIIGATGLYDSTTSTLTMTVPAGSASTDVSVDWYNQSSALQDVAVTNVASSKTVVGQGLSLPVNVTIANQGTLNVTCDVTLFANTTGVKIETSYNLANGTSRILSFSWDTTGSELGNYTMTAYAWPVPGETNTANNNLTDGWVIVSIVGDITGLNGWPDGKVDMRDVGYVARRFMCNPGDPLWDPNTDTNDDGKIDMRDAWLVAKHFEDHHS